MRVGLLGLRADERGLARLTTGFHAAMKPHRTLAIDMGTAGFPADFSRYPDATVVPFAGGRIEPDVLRKFLRGLDVCYMAETPYDYSAYDIAREVGCRTALAVMPEFWRYGAEPHLPAPDRVWAPTSWRLDTLPEGTPIIPVPVALDRFPGVPSVREPGEPLRVLHVAGKMAAMDRNGTRAFLDSLSRLRSTVAVTVLSQDRRVGRVPRLPPNVTITVRDGGADYAAMYAGHHVLVTPRRYGGLSLPTQEAMAAGLAVVMPDVSPNRDWPIVPVPATVGNARIRTQAGPIQLANVRPVDLTRVIDRLAEDEGERSLAAKASVEWAHAHSWAALRPLYLRELARA